MVRVKIISALWFTMFLLIRFSNLIHIANFTNYVTMGDFSLVIHCKKLIIARTNQNAST